MIRVGKWVAGSFSTLALGFWLLAGTPAEAFTCSVTGTSGGNPGGLDVYTCTDLVEGDTFTMTVDQTENDVDVLFATAEITVIDISDGSVTLGINVTNTSSGDNRITSFGLGIEPTAAAGDVSDTSATDTDELTTFDEGNFPGFTLVEFCATSGTNCAGGGSDGLTSGQNDEFNFDLTNGFVEGGSIDLSQFSFKFQGGEESYEKPGSPVGGSPVGGEPVAGEPVAGQVPQPGSLMLVGAALLSGLVASAGLRRVRRNRE